MWRQLKKEINSIHNRARITEMYSASNEAQKRHKMAKKINKI